MLLACLRASYFLYFSSLKRAAQGLLSLERILAGTKTETQPGFDASSSNVMLLIKRVGTARSVLLFVSDAKSMGAREKREEGIGGRLRLLSLS